NGRWPPIRKTFRRGRWRSGRRPSSGRGAAPTETWYARNGRDAQTALRQRAGRGHPRRHPPHGHLVAASRHRGPRAGRLRHLLDVGGAPERALLRSALPLALLLAVCGPVLPSQDVRFRAPGRASAHPGRGLTGLPHPVGAGPLPPHLLLLPQGLLPLVLAVPARLRGARRPPHLHGRDALPPPSAEPAPLRVVRGGHLHLPPHLGRPPRLPLPRPL